MTNTEREVQVFVYADIRDPAYILLAEPEIMADHPIAVPPSTLKRWTKTIRAYEAVQDEIEKTLQQHRRKSP